MKIPVLIPVWTDSALTTQAGEETNIRRRTIYHIKMTSAFMLDFAGTAALHIKYQITSTPPRGQVVWIKGA